MREVKTEKKNYDLPGSRGEKYGGRWVRKVVWDQRRDRREGGNSLTEIDVPTRTSKVDIRILRIYNRGWFKNLV